MPRRKLNSQISPLARGKPAAQLIAQTAAIAGGVAADRAIRAAGKAAGQAVRNKIRRAMTPSPPQSVTAPLRVSAIMGPLRYSSQPVANGIVCTGRTYLGEVLAPETSLDGTSLGVYAINPTLFSDRMGVEASIYDKHVFEYVRALYVPSCPTTRSGTLALVLDRDPTDPPCAPDNWAAIMSSEAAVSGQVWCPLQTTLKRDPAEKRTYFNSFDLSDPREQEQFRLTYYTTGAAAVGSVASIGQLYLEYRVRLISPVNNTVPRSIVTYAQYKFGIFSNLTMTATSNVVNLTWSSTSSTTAANAGNIYEVVITSTPGAGGSFQPNLSNATVCTLRTGSRVYLVQASSATTFNMYDNVEDALGRSDTERAYNPSATTTILLPPNSTYMQRTVGLRASDKFAIAAST